MTLSDICIFTTISVEDSTDYNHTEKNSDFSDVHEFVLFSSCINLSYLLSACYMPGNGDHPFK